MDIASGQDEDTEVPMDTGAGGGGEVFSSSLDFPWPFKQYGKDQQRDESRATNETSSSRISVSADCYNMTHKRRGRAVMINQENFSREMREEGLSKRTGTNIDERQLRMELKKLGFQVDSYPDLKANQIKNVLSRVAAEDHSDADCFVCVILSHGEEGVVFGTDKRIEIKELTNFFKGDKCPGLIGKPKLFIIQACRGYQTDEGFPINVADALPMDADDLPNIVPQCIRLPVEADFLFAYSTVPGYYSWRNGMNGSWYVQALADMLAKYGETMEIQHLLTKVHRMVSQNFESRSDQPGFYKKKQVPSLVSMLTKDLYFRKKEKPRK